MYVVIIRDTDTDIIAVNGPFDTFEAADKYARGLDLLTANDFEIKLEPELCDDDGRFRIDDGYYLYHEPVELIPPGHPSPYRG